jgi:hypothetical protein
LASRENKNHRASRARRKSPAHHEQIRLNVGIAYNFSGAQTVSLREQARKIRLFMMALKLSPLGISFAKFTASVQSNPKTTNMKKLITVSLYLIIGALAAGVASATTSPNAVPDAASTSALLSMTVAGLAVVRRYVRR